MNLKQIILRIILRITKMKSSENQMDELQSKELRQLYENYCYAYNCVGCDLRCQKILNKYN